MNQALSSPPYDAVLLVAFGGPEKMDDVIPFLENVLRGKPVPRERLLEVAHHYELFNGVSPINEQMRQLRAALQAALQQAGIELPIYWGNRNWDPLLPETIAQMQAAGVRKSLALMVSAYSSYSGCRQYRENLRDACEPLGETAPQFDKLRVFYNHPLFIRANVARLQESLEQIPAAQRSQAKIFFTAHSLPMSMARTSDYEKQLHETCRLVCEQLEIPADRWELVYQSRSGRPEDPWLEPDILDALQTCVEQPEVPIIIDPLGFLSDHMEVLYDLDIEARQFCESHGLQMIRTKTVGTHPDFVNMLVELIAERLSSDVPKRSIGQFGPNHDLCPHNCCPAPQRPVRK